MSALQWQNAYRSPSAPEPVPSFLGLFVARVVHHARLWLTPQPQPVSETISPRVSITCDDTRVLSAAVLRRPYEVVLRRVLALWDSRCKICVYAQDGLTREQRKTVSQLVDYSTDVRSQVFQAVKKTSHIQYSGNSLELNFIMVLPGHVNSFILVLSDHDWSSGFINVHMTDFRIVEMEVI